MIMIYQRYTGGEVEYNEKTGCPMCCNFVNSAGGVQ